MMRKLLIIFTLPAAPGMVQSRLQIDELTTGSFHEVVDDQSALTAKANGADRLLLGQGGGRIVERDRLTAPVAVVRIEQLFPFPQQQLLDLLATYPGTRRSSSGCSRSQRTWVPGIIEHLVWRVKEQGYDIRHVARRVGQPGHWVSDDPRPGARRLMEETATGS